MKSTIIQLDPRIEVKPDTIQGIQKYDIDNAYPQRVRLIGLGSPTTKSCLTQRAKFIRGEGFQEQSFYGAPVNRNKGTWDSVMRACSEDYALYNGFALHLNYNLLGEITEINHIPFEYVRLVEADDSGYAGFVKIYDNWDKKKSRNVDEKKIKTIPLYNPDVVLAQIEKAGGIENYNGQVFYYTPNFGEYPLSSIDSIIEDCETDGELKYFKNRTVTTNFMASHIYVQKGKFENNKDREAFLKNLKTFQGARNASALFVVETESDDQIPELKQVNSNIDDKVFEYTESSIRKNIITNFGIPSILLGIPTQGALGEKNEREQAKNIYSDITEDDRLLMSAVFAELFAKWHRQEDNPTGNFSIIPITSQANAALAQAELLKDMTQNERRELLLNLPPQEQKTAATKLLVETLGVGGTQALQQILIDTTLRPEQKVKILQLVFGFTEDDAKAVIYSGQEQTETPPTDGN